MSELASLDLPYPWVRDRSAARRRFAPPDWVALVAVCAALGPALSAAAAPRAVAGEVEVEALSIAELKRVYLACDQAAADGRLTSAGVMQCSVVYEHLKRRAFGGDFERLRVWSRAQSRTAGHSP